MKPLLLLLPLVLAACPSSSPSAAKTPTTTAPSTTTAAQRPQEKTLKVSHAAYDLSVGVDDPCDGAGCNVVVDVTPKAPHHINAEYPHKLVWKPGAPAFAMTVPMTPEGHLEGAFSGVTAATTVEGTLKMSVCSDERCLIEEIPLQLALRR